MVNDLLEQYAKWKLKGSTNNKNCQNYCIWAHESFPPIGHKLWNPYLIDKNILYVSDFIKPGDNEIYSYLEFLEIYELDKFYLPRNDYSAITSALKLYNRRGIPSRNIHNLQTDLTLKFFEPFKEGRPLKIKGSDIRKAILSYSCPNVLGPLVARSEDLKVVNIQWNTILENTFTSCNNLKLIQFQYKLLMRISTCKYKRFKMKLSPNDKCTKCNNNEIETLKHLFLECPASLSFMEAINRLISERVEPGYSDKDMRYFITCGHSNKIVNYINMVSKWYISRSFQSDTPILWSGFLRLTKKILLGEKKEINDKVLEILA